MAVNVFHGIVQQCNEFCKVRDALLDPLQGTHELLQVRPIGRFLHKQKAFQSARVVTDPLGGYEPSVPADLRREDGTLRGVELEVAVYTYLKERPNRLEQSIDLCGVNEHVVQPGQHVRL